MEPQFDEEVQFFLDMIPMNEVIESHKVDNDARWVSYMLERVMRPMATDDKVEPLGVEMDRLCSASNPDTPHSVMWAIWETGYEEELELLAGNEGAPSDLLLCLSTFVGSPSTVRRIWGELEDNPSTPPEAFEFPKDVPPLELDDEPVAFF